ncbi:hydroxyethylthiazole kinase [Alkaliphilus peptidifermentans]|uniref:Hydroxyethylthiazole kinase n=1 Tax=Alkaliphilus peptidifermentans DSM 18978 TaxID=1120976 RepID=A0A1G5FU92_9FIRM|nr:hydroxyethylthiazole kinase [Alkaliphilus peptidifermentans]SCY42833.1 hydroxyethylthiazole kinase [Alkaliphilus peptidifermentans DSM 18978]
MNLIHNFAHILEKIKSDKPLVHHITNYVTVNDCANAVLAIGGAPVMADDPREVEEMVSIASSLVLNTGTLNNRTIESFILAGKKANTLDIPVILDPVGVGATTLRTETVKRIIDEVKLTVLRGNMSEIMNINGTKAITRGVDSTDDTMAGGREVAQSLSKRLGCVVAITGATDIVSDGTKVYYIQHGHEMLARVTGTGCMTTSLIGLCCGTKEIPIYGAMLGIVVMGAAGERAYEENVDEGVGSYRVKLMDAIGNFSVQQINEGEKIYEG